MLHSSYHNLFLFLALTLFSPFGMKTDVIDTEKVDFDQRMVCEAPVCMLKYTTDDNSQLHNLSDLLRVFGRFSDKHGQI